MEKRTYIFNKPVTEIIRSRKSVRTYEPSPLEEAVKRDLDNYIKSLKGPFSGKVRFKLVDISVALNDNIKLGTYGIIKGAYSFAASAAFNGDMNLEELGYELESFVLYATSLGLGTCWLGGTFKKGEFAKALELKQDEILPIVTPVGYPAKNERIVGSLMRTFAGSKNRKPWDELFYQNSFENKLSKNDAGDYAEALEMVRLAPSASNKQPWRIVKDNNKLHFYIQHTKGYSSALGFDMQRIDIGIAMCHINLTLKEAGFEGNFKKINPNIKLLNDLTEYVVTWVKK